MTLNKTLTNIKQLEILAEGIRLEDLINQEFQKALKEKFPHYEVRFSEIDIVLIDKSLTDKEKIEKVKSSIKSSKDKKEISIPFPIEISLPTESITLKHRGENDYTMSRILVNVDNENLLKDFLGIFDVK